MIRRLPPRLVVPAIAVLALVPWIVYCARTYPDHALYFDHSMYQYTGWCLRNGVSLYGGVAVPDGPFITWLHAAVQTIAGESDRAFRWADLAIQTVGALAIGFVIAPYKRRWAWACAIAALWLAQYFRYDWGMTAQRESYYALAGYLGMAMLVLATRRTGRIAIALSIAGGVLVGSQLFGKHTGLAFVVLGLLPALLGPRGKIKPRVGWALAGVGSAIVLGVAALALWGSLGDFWFWYFRFPWVYRHLVGSNEPWPLLFLIDRHTVVLAVIALLAGVAAIRLRVLPRAYLGFAVAPVLFLAAMVLQRKGYIYQGHPITAGAYLVLALIAIHLVRGRGKHLIAGAVLTVLLIGDATRELAKSPWIDPDPPTTTSQLGAPHVNHGDLAAAAQKVAEVTEPGDRVFAFGPAGRLLYEARRPPAVPPFNNFFLNIRRALFIEITAGQRATLERFQREIRRRSCPGLDEKPAAVAICDGAAWGTGQPGLVDAAEVCKQLEYVKPPDFVEVGHYGCWHVYARSDRVPQP